MYISRHIYVSTMDLIRNEVNKQQQQQLKHLKIKLRLKLKLKNNCYK